MLWLLRLGFRLLRDLRGARGIDQLGGFTQVIIRHLGTVIKSGQRARRAQREKRCAQAVDAEPRGQSRERGQRVVRRDHLCQTRARVVQIGGGGQHDRAAAPLFRLDMKGQPVSQRVGQALFRPGAFVQCDEAVTGALIEDARQPRGKAGAGAFGHGQDQPAGRVDQAGVGHGPPLCQGRGDIEPAEKLRVGNRGMDAARVAGKAGEGRLEHLAGRAKAGAQAKPAKPAGIQRQRRQCTGGGRRHCSTSATARLTRAPDPASSSGSRRKRCAKASGATRAR